MSALMDYLPPLYRGSPETVSVELALQPEVDGIWSGRDDLLRQTDPNTATWGLDLWERALGLTPEAGRALDFRRTRVISRIRGSGTTTKALIQSVAESFANGEVAVVEIPAQFKVEIHFTGLLGVPPNMDDLEAALNDVVPAHLAWEFVIYYRTYRQLKDYTHGQLYGHTHTQLREEGLQ